MTFVRHHWSYISLEDMSFGPSTPTRASPQASMPTTNKDLKFHGELSYDANESRAIISMHSLRWDGSNMTAGLQKGVEHGVLGNLRGSNY